MRQILRGSAVALLVLLAAACGCSRQEPAPAPSTRASVPYPSATGFIDRTPGSGITAVNHTGDPVDKQWIVEAKAGGGLVLDYDGDGKVDVYLIDGNECKLDSDGNVITRTANPAARNHLYRNLGGFRFEDVTDKAGVGDKSFGFGGGVGDYDNDGDEDIYVCNWGRNVLYRNNGNGTFTNVAKSAGVTGALSDFSTGATFFDADGDGDLDLYVANYCDIEQIMRETHGHGRHFPFHGFKVLLGPRGIPPLPDRFYRNLGDGTFRDETATALADQKPRYAFTAVPADFDRDGDEDLYVANDSVPNTLWLNDGTGHFKDVADQAGVDVDGFGTRQAGMGCDSADYDQDGWPDIIVTNFSWDSNTLYRNITREVGSLMFEDVRTAVGFPGADYSKTCWGVKFVDFDQDGYLDLFISAGQVFPVIDRVKDEVGTTYRELPSLWLSSGPPKWKFREAPDSVRGPGLSQKIVGRGASFADFDNDGDVDVIVTRLNARPLLLENRMKKKGSWIEFRLEGTGKSNRDAFGAKVTVTARGGKYHQMQECRVAASFAGANDPRLMYGLGPVRKVDRVEIVWPDHQRQTFTNLAANHRYRVTEGSEPVRVR